MEEILGPVAESTGEASKFSVNTFETEEKELGIQTILTFVDTLGTQLGAEYLDTTLKVVYPLVNYTLNDQVRASAAGVLPAIVNCMTGDKEAKAKEFIEYLWKTLTTEYDPDTQSMQLQAVKECIENVGLFLT